MFLYTNVPKAERTVAPPLTSGQARHLQSPRIAPGKCQEMDLDDLPLPAPEGWTEDDIAKLEAVITHEVRRQLNEWLDDPVQLCAMLLHALNRQERERKAQAI